MLRVNITRALNTMLSTIDYLDVERVPPLSRRSFKQLLDGWALSPEAWCDPAYARDHANPEAWINPWSRCAPDESHREADEEN